MIARECASRVAIVNVHKLAAILDFPIGLTLDYFQSHLNGYLDISSLTVRSIGPRSKPVIYATTREGGVYKTTNLGLSWAPSNNGLTDTEIVAILCDIKLPPKLYAASFATGVHLSDDNGLNWSHVST